MSQERAGQIAAVEPGDTEVRSGQIGATQIEFIEVGLGQVAHIGLRCRRILLIAASSALHVRISTHGIPLRPRGLLG